MKSLTSRARVGSVCAAAALALANLAAPSAAVTILDTIGDGSKYQIGRELTKSIQLGFDAYPVSGDFTGVRPVSAVGGVNLKGTSGVPCAELWLPGDPGKLTVLNGAYASWLIQPFTAPVSGYVSRVEFIAQFRQSAGYEQGPGRTAFVGILDDPGGSTLPSLPAMVGVDVSKAALGTVVTATGLNKTLTAGSKYWLVFAPVSTLGSWNANGLDYANLNWTWKSVAPQGSSVSDPLYNNRNGVGSFVKMPGRVLGVRLSGLTSPPVDKTAGEARNTSDGTVVNLKGVVVSAKSGAVGPGFFYVQAADRSAGIRVVGSCPFDVGERVNVIGTMTTAGVERAVALESISSTGAGASPVRLGMQNAFAAGQDMGLVSGKTGGVGLNNVGLLVRVFGKVSPASGNDFLLNDGSTDIICRVASGITKPGSGLVAVTGVVSLEQKSGARVPVILVRSQSDIAAL